MESSLLGAPAAASTGPRHFVAHARAAVTIFGCTVSGGLVAIPKAYQTVGLAPALIMSMIAGPTTGLSLVALAMCSQRAGGASTYGDVARKMTGPLLACGIDLLISLFLIGVLAGSFIVLRDWFVALTPRKEDAVVATIGVAAVGMLPLSLPRSIGFLAYSSFLSLAGFSLLVIVLVVYGLQSAISHAPPSDGILSFQSNVTNSSSSTVWWPDSFDPLALGLSFNVQMYSFACQFQLMAIFQDLSSRLRESSPTASPVRARFGAVVCGAVSGMIVLFGATGVFGVLAFPGKQLDGDVLKELAYKPIGKVVRGCLTVGIGLSGPLMVHPTREGFVRFGALVAQRLGWLSESRYETVSKRPPWIVHAAITAGIIAVSTTVALTFDKLMVLVGFLAAFLLIPLGLFFPAVALLILPPPPSHDERTSVSPLVAATVSDPPQVGSTFGAGDAPSALFGASTTRSTRRRGLHIWLLVMWMTIVTVVALAVTIWHLTADTRG